MFKISRRITLSTLAAVAASSLCFVACESYSGMSRKGATVNMSTPAPRATNMPRATSVSMVLPEKHAASIRMTTHVLLVTRTLLDKAHVKFDLMIPTHHVRPDSSETENGAAVIDEITASHLLDEAQEG